MLYYYYKCFMKLYVKGFLTGSFFVFCGIIYIGYYNQGDLLDTYYQAYLMGANGEKYG
jgi:hypothetical protein